MLTIRRRPAGPPAAAVRGRSGGVGRSTSAPAEAVSDALRRGASSSLTRRRGVAATSLGSIAALAAVAAYQTGLVRRLPEPPGRLFDAGSVDASGAAYRLLGTPDAGLGLVSYAATLVLAGMGGDDRTESRPWLALALAAKVVADAAAAGFLVAEQVSRHRRLCSWCTLSALASFAAVPLALPDGAQAWRAIRRR